MTLIQTLSNALAQEGIVNRVEKFDAESEVDDLIILDIHPERQVFIQVEHGNISVNEWFSETETATFINTTPENAVATVKNLINKS